MGLEQGPQLGKGVVLHIAIGVRHTEVHASRIRIIIVSMRRNEASDDASVHDATEALKDPCANARQIWTHDAAATHVGPADARNLREAAEVEEADAALDSELHVRQHDSGGGYVEDVGFEVTGRNLTHFVPASAGVEVGRLPGGRGGIRLPVFHLVDVDADRGVGRAVLDGQDQPSGLVVVGNGDQHHGALRDACIRGGRRDRGRPRQLGTAA